MYDLTDVVPETEVAPGTNVLLAGPPLTGKRAIALRLLAAGSDRGEGAIVVTTKDGSDRIVSEYGEFVGNVDDVDLGVIDCVARQQGPSGKPDDERVKYADSPVDMAGIGIELSKFLETFYNERGLDRNRILLHSLSTLLMYVDVQTVFRFLHVFTGRIQSADALGVFVIDSTAHDERTMNILKQLFDVIVTVEEGDGSLDLRVDSVYDYTSR